MTVPSTTSRVTYAGNGSSVSFAISFYFLSNADIVVLLVDAVGNSTTQVLNTHYTLTGAGVEAGGTLTMLTAPPSGYSLIIYRDPALTQLTDYAPNDPFPAETHERALDRLTMIAQRLKELVTRSIRIPDSDISGVSTAIPSPVPGRSLKWSNDGLSLVNSANDPDTVVATAAASANAAAASASAADVSADAAAQSVIDAALIYDQFDDRYLGAKAADPTVDNDGDALLTGALYWNTVVSKLKTYTGSAWVVTDGIPNDGSVTTAKVANGAITPAKLDRAYAELAAAQSFTKAQRGAVVALTDGATITPDFSLGNNYSVTLGGNRTLANPTNIVAGQSGVIAVTQDGTGSRTLAFGSNWKFSLGTAPTLTATAGAVDLIAYYIDSASRIDARFIGDAK